MLISAVSVLVVAQSSSKIPERLMNNPVYIHTHIYVELHVLLYQTNRQLLQYAAFSCTECSNIILLKSGSSGQVGAEGGGRAVPVQAMTACGWEGGE